MHAHTFMKVGSMPRVWFHRHKCMGGCHEIEAWQSGGSLGLYNFKPYSVCFHEALKLVWQVYFGWTTTFKVKAN